MKHTPAITGRALGYREVQVLNLVRQHIEAHGIAPTYSMISEETGIATRGGISRIIARLEKRGLIFRVGKFKPRTRRVYRMGAVW